MLASDNQYSLPTRTAGGNTTLLQNFQLLSLRSLKKIQWNEKCCSANASKQHLFRNNVISTGRFNSISIHLPRTLLHHIAWITVFIFRVRNKATQFANCKSFWKTANRNCVIFPFELFYFITLLFMFSLAFSFSWNVALNSLQIHQPLEHIL